MKLGVVPLLSGDSGGVYQYCLMVLEALRTPGTLRVDDSVTLFVHDTQDSRLTEVSSPDWSIQPLRPPSLRRHAATAARAIPLIGSLIDLLRKYASYFRGSAGHRSNTQPGREQEKWFRSLGIDLMLYPVPMSISFECRIPYVFTVHDLQHRLQPHFPEVGEPAEWQAREALFKRGIEGAEVVIVDSEIGREDVMACYGNCGISAERVRVLPFVPPNYGFDRPSLHDQQEVRLRYKLPDRYFFYPAQFWPHKNHLRLISALALLRDHYSISAHLVLSGSRNNEIRSRTFSDLCDLIQELGLQAQVHYLGFVPDSDMPALYAGSLALTMPTFFGPTNIPILEAWSLGCPVLTSDIRGVRDQAGDGALLVDPTSVSALADGLFQLWCDDALREQLRTNGAKRLEEFTKEDFAQQLSDIIELARGRVLSSRPSTSQPQRHNQEHSHEA
ncbi:MAG: glycosyltransferase family 4 protein [Alphaproteobacteria bacterium]|nr:glycosyltransferase family 4 protein [Alphaproteobacteria bacterium]